MLGFPGGLMVKDPPAVRETWVGKIPWEGRDTYSIALEESSWTEEPWWVTVHGVAESDPTKQYSTFWKLFEMNRDFKGEGVKKKGGLWIVSCELQLWFLKDGNFWVVSNSSNEFNCSLNYIPRDLSFPSNYRLFSIYQVEDFQIQMENPEL